MPGAIMLERAPSVETDSISGASTGAVDVHQQSKLLTAALERRLVSQATTVALYDALLTKLDALALWSEAPPRPLLESFRREACEHSALLRGALDAARVRQREVDGPTEDPTGSMRVLADDRVTVAQCVHALVSALVVAADGWAQLSQLAGELSPVSADGFTEAFVHASSDQQRQWQTLLGWLCAPSMAASELRSSGQTAVYAMCNGRDGRDGRYGRHGRHGPMTVSTETGSP